MFQYATAEHQHNLEKRPSFRHERCSVGIVIQSASAIASPPLRRFHTEGRMRWFCWIIYMFGLKRVFWLFAKVWGGRSRRKHDFNIFGGCFHVTNLYRHSVGKLLVLMISFIGCIRGLNWETLRKCRFGDSKCLFGHSSAANTSTTIDKFGLSSCWVKVVTY